MALCTDRPLAAVGLTSYRCKSRHGWIMIGARDHADAMSEARRSYEGSKVDDLEIWNGNEYVAVEWDDDADDDRLTGQDAIEAGWDHAHDHRKNEVA